MNRWAQICSETRCGVCIFTGDSIGRLFTGRFCIMAGSVGTLVTVFGSSGGLEDCSSLNCFICPSAPFLHVRLQSTVCFCSALKKTRSYSSWGKEYIIMIKVVIPKERQSDMCIIYSLQIYKRSFESVHITLWVTDVSYLVFSEDPSISVVKEK